MVQSFCSESRGGGGNCLQAPMKITFVIVINIFDSD